MSLKHPKLQPPVRIMNGVKEICEPWLRMVKEIVFDRQVPPRYIINVDETPFGGDGSITTPPQVVSPLNSPPKPIIAAEPRHLNFTITLAVSLDGNDLPTQLIWKAANIPPEFWRLPVNKVSVFANKSGYQDQTTFLQYMRDAVFPPLLQMRERCNERAIPIIVFLDNHSSRYSDEFKLLCRDNFILPIMYPPNTSHLLQVLDQHINGTLKQLYSTYIHELQSYPFEDKVDVPFGIPNLSNPNKESCYRERFVWSISRALSDTLTARGITNAWKEAGLYDEHSFETRISTIPSNGGMEIPFDRNEYILVPEVFGQWMSIPQPETILKIPRKMEKSSSDKKPTSEPRKSSTKLHVIHVPKAREILAEKERRKGLISVVTRSGRRTTTFDWSGIDSNSHPTVSNSSSPGSTTEISPPQTQSAETQ